MPSTHFAHPFFRFARWALAGATLTLAACGGGGSSNPPSTLGTVVGAWEDQTSTRRTLAALVLPNETHWVFYRYSSDGSAGFEQGQASATGNTLQASLMEYPNGFSTRAVAVSAQMGSNSITGTRTWAGGSDSFALTPMPVSAFNAQHTPQISDIQGSWSGTLSSASSSSAATWVLQGDGMFSGSNGGCQYTGSLSPMANANAYQISLNFVAGTCPFSTTTTTGLAMAYHPSSSSTQLFVAVQDGPRQLGWLFTATR